MKEKYKYLGKNTLVFAISSFGTKFLSFLLVPLYTNVLTTEEYGVADLITTTATLMIFIFTINIADAVLRYAIEKEKDQEEILAYGIRVLLIGSLVLLFVLGIVWWANIILWKNIYYVFVFLYFFSVALYQLLTNYLRSIDKIKEVAIAGIVSSLIMILCNVLFLVFIKIGIYGYLIALILGPIMGSVYCVCKINIPFVRYINKVCDITTQKAMIKYCTPLIFNNIALWINAFLDKYFVTAICGLDENGIYAVASKIPTVLSICYSVFSQAWNLSAIKEFDKDDKDGFFSDTYKVYNALIVCMCSGLILVNIPLAKILYAKDFFSAWQYSSVLLLSIMFNAMTVFLGGVFTAVKDSKTIAISTIISAVVNIVFNIILIPRYGALGAAIATATCYAVMWMVRILVSQKYIKLKITIYKDVLAYCLLGLQVYFEHIEKHFYCGQILIFLMLMVLYGKLLLKTLLSLKK